MNIIEVFERFPNQDDCIKYLEQVRWKNIPRCPYCNSINSTIIPQKRYHCNNCNISFSVTVDTIFHATHLPLQKWFLAISLILNAKKGMSARQLSRHLKVNKDTAWRISMKIREAMCVREQRELLTGIVEADDTCVGGKPRKGSGNNKRGRGTNKTPLVGMVERKGKVRVEVAKKDGLTSRNIKALVRRNIDTSNAVLITDEFSGYLGIKSIMSHERWSRKKSNFLQ